MSNENQGKFNIQYECPKCYIPWDETGCPTPKQYKVVQQKECDICRQGKLSSRDLLERQIAHLDFMYLHRFPEVIRNLYNHMQLKAIDEKD